MKKAFYGVLALVALVASTAASTGCIWIFLDEPKAPKSIN